MLFNWLTAFPAPNDLYYISLQNTQSVTSVGYLQLIVLSLKFPTDQSDWVGLCSPATSPNPITLSVTFIYKKKKDNDYKIH